MMLFINKMFILLYFEDSILHERMLIFNSFFVVVKMTERRKNQTEEWT